MTRSTLKALSAFRAGNRLVVDTMTACDVELSRNFEATAHRILSFHGQAIGLTGHEMAELRSELFEERN